MRRIWFIPLVLFVSLGLLVVARSALAGSPSPLAAPRAAQAPAAAALTPTAGVTTTFYSWQAIPLPTGVTTNSVQNLVVHPTDAYTVFLATFNGVFKSTNAGQSWSPLAPGTLTFAYDLAIAPSSPLRLYANAGTLYRSDNGGASWSPVAAPLENCGLTVAPSDPQRVYAIKCSDDNTPAVYRSPDGGQTWQPASASFTETLRSLVVSPTQPGVLVGATFSDVFLSPDGGATWTKAPVQTGYYPRPHFAPQPPYTLYIGHWDGLHRSLDGGASWEASDLQRDVRHLIVMPGDPDLVLGGFESESWQIQSAGANWSLQAWNAPKPLRELWQSRSDNRVFYARTPAGLWRAVRTSQVQAYGLFLPITPRSSASLPLSAQLALARANEYRAKLGLLPLRLHPAAVAAAQNHANYYQANRSNNAAWSNGIHGEVPGQPGYTGQNPAERMAAAGFPWSGSSEVITFLGNPTASVDDWIHSVYHRFPLINPNFSYIGYGLISGSGAIDVMDFGYGPVPAGQWGSTEAYIVSYPAHQQTGVPTAWKGGELPNPLPPGAVLPSGYPFTLQGFGGVLEVTSIYLKDGANQTVAVHPNPADCTTSYNCYSLIAVSPLQPNTTYTVQVGGNLGGVKFIREYKFTTAGQ